MNSQEDRVLQFTILNGRMERESKKLRFILYEALYEPLVFLQITYRQLIILVAMFLSGAFIFSYYEHLPAIAALLASVSTITTIGLYVPNSGNFVTLNHTEAILLIGMIIVSVGTGASIVQTTIGAFVNGNLAKGRAEERMIKMLKNHVVVYGYGHLGKYVAEKLQEVGMDYVVVTTEQQFYDTLLKQKVLTVLEHESRPMEALRAAGIQKAGTLIVSHQNDPNNMMVTLSARRLRPDLRIVSVVHDTELVDAAKNAGADVVIPSSLTVGHLLALSAMAHNLVGIVFSEETGTKEIARFSIFKASRLIGKGMQDVAKVAVVIGVVRNGSVVQSVFDPSFRLAEGDTLLVLGAAGDLAALEREAGAT